MYDRPLFRAEELAQNTSPVFITVTEPQAIEILNAGFPAIALGGWENAEALTDLVKNSRRAPVLMLATSDGTTGEDATKTGNLGVELTRAGARVHYATGTAMELLNPDGTTKAMKEAAAEDTEKAWKVPAPGPAVISGADFMRTQYDAAQNYFRQYKDRKTGFEDIDKDLTLYPGLAMLTGVSSLGKTSFAVQLADQLADRGETVLYFTLEQTPIELVTKTLARKLADRAPLPAIFNTDIKNGATSEDLEAVKEEYAQTTGTRVHFCPGTFETTADEIVDTVQEFEARHRVRPVVFVDYLQLIAAPSDPNGRRLDDRGRVDDAVKKLKRLSVDDQLFILAISNMARTSYSEKIGADSFKESGNIEYTADYLFGLQLTVLEADEFFKKKGTKGGTKETIKAEKQDYTDEAFAETPRRIVFKCIKNRNGRKDFKAYFINDPRRDSFWKDPDPKEYFERIKNKYNASRSLTTTPDAAQSNSEDDEGFNEVAQMMGW